MRSKSTGTGRAASHGRFMRSTSTPRRTIPTPGLRRRRPPQRSGVMKVVAAIAPVATAKKATPSSKKGKAGGLALIAAAAGMAFKNRDKLRRSDSGATASTAPSGNTSSPQAGAAV
jgi:hypothetical protein